MNVTTQNADKSIIGRYVGKAKAGAKAGAKAQLAKAQLAKAKAAKVAKAFLQRRTISGSESSSESRPLIAATESSEL